MGVDGIGGAGPLGPGGPGPGGGVDGPASPGGAAGAEKGRAAERAHAADGASAADATARADGPVDVAGARLEAGELGIDAYLEALAPIAEAVRVLKENGAHPLQVSPSQLKKYITGKGRAEKNQILLHTYKRWGVEFANDNAADSFGLAKIAAGEAKNKAQEEVLKALQDPKHRGAV